MENYIRRENLALFKKRFAEARDDSERAIIAKLLAEKEAKDAAVPPKS
jgi:hypothetical protein